jgi:hypothetical protein
MSELRDAVFDIVDDRLAATSDPVVNSRTGATFTAEIEPIEDMALNTELGIDPRASTIFHIRDKTVDIAASDILQALGKQFRVLPRVAPDNPLAPQLKIYAQVIVSGKDS